MIVNCPSCSANYRIKTEIIDPQKGRVVRCSACGNSWRVFIHANPPKKEAPVDIPQQPIQQRTPQQQNKINRPFSAKQVNTNTTPKRSYGIIKLFFMMLFYGAIFGGMYWFRFDIVKKFPQTERFYKLLNIDVQITGISIFEPYLEKIEHKDGHTSILIVGTFVNSHRKDTLKIPPLRISLLNGENMPIKTFVKSDFDPQTLPPAGRSDFSYKIPAIPKNTVDVRIEFETQTKQ